MRRIFLLCLSIFVGLAGCGDNASREGADIANDAASAADAAVDAAENAVDTAEDAVDSLMAKTDDMVEAAGKAPPCELTVGWDPWEPYQFQDVDGNMRGLDIEILNSIADRAGCELEYKEGRWATLLRELQAGSIDLMTGATKTAARETFAFFSTPYRDEDFELYVRAGELGKYNSTDIVNLLDNGFRLGVTEQYVYGDTVSDLQENPKYADQFVGATIGALNYERLMDFDIDGFLEDPFVASSYIRNKGLADEIAKHPLVVHSGKVHLMFSQTSVPQDTVERMDTALADMRADGTYQEIVEKYLR